MPSYEVRSHEEFQAAARILAVLADIPIELRMPALATACAAAIDTNYLTRKEPA